AEERVVELDQLGVDGRVVASERFHRSLPVLAVPAAARRAVAVHRGDRVELDRLRVAVHAVLDVRAADRRGALGPERERAVGAVGEGVHLLLHHVGARTGGAREERRVLEHRRHDPPGAVQPAEALDLLCDVLPGGHLVRDDVMGPAWPLDLPAAAHPAAFRSASRSSARNGFRASSAPSVVDGPWPGCRAVSRGKRSASVPIDASSVGQSPPGRSVRPTEPANSTSPERSTPSTAYARCPGELPGTATTSTCSPASSSDSPPSRSTSAVHGLTWIPGGVN